jgi:eukaryotic-like serine/threonine-protein kinase
MAIVLPYSAEEVAAHCEGTPYLAERFLGRGGMGEVWVVRHEFLGSEFALKILDRRFVADPELIDRMRLEAQVAANIDHPNIVPVIDFWVTAAGIPCIAMELLSGRTMLQEVKARGQLPADETIRIGCQILSAVSAAHRHGILHRDIKPDNVFLHELPGQLKRARLLDFGLARVFRENPAQPISELAMPTRTGAVLGSPLYMSPEAKRGEPIDERGDVYSVGMTLYYSMTRRMPFSVDPSDKSLVPASAHVKGVSAELDELLLLSLATERDDRLKSAAEFEARLRRLLPSRPHRTSAR